MTALLVMFAGSASEGATALKAGDSAVGGELLVTREQLVDLFQVGGGGWALYTSKYQFIRVVNRNG
jgi:hypothetical protein